MDALGVIGCGQMAFALLKGIQEREKRPSYVGINDTDPQRLELFTQNFTVKSESKAEIAQKCEIIILAVKPQQIKAVITEIKPFLSPGQLLISIAAGISTVSIEQQLGSGIAVIRVMPNAPCLIGQGVCVISPGAIAKETHLQITTQLLEQMGKVLQVEEKHMDAITALSGSGPAYVYLFAEAMINAGVYLGLNIDLAREIITEMIAGSVGMLQATSQHPAVLRDQVCSPGGTTIAAIKQMEQDGFRQAVFNGIEKAYLRSVELGQ